MTEARIVKINSQYPKIITIAKWIFSEWGHIKPENSLETTIALLKGRCGDMIPSMYVAEVDNMPVGTASLIECDMEIRQQYTPWLASVYVDANWRNQGIGSQIVGHVENEAKNHKVKKLYLFTPNRQKMYFRLGWQQIEELEYKGHNLVTIMMKDLTS